MDLLLNAILLVFVTAVVGGLALLAQWGRKNRAAEISLIVILLAFSVLLLLLVAVLGTLAFFARNTEQLQGAAPSAADGPLLAASVLVMVLAALVGIALCIPPLRKVTRRRRIGYQEPVGLGSASREATPEAGEQEVSGRWADPPIFFGLWMFVMVLSYNVVNLLSFSELVESGVFESADPVSPSLVVMSELPFVIVALCGVGMGVRRPFREVIRRLGYGPLTLAQLGIIPVFVAAGLALEVGFNFLFSWLQPELFESVGEISEGLFNADNLSLPAAILFGLLIGVGAAAGEETLFRGAVQPAIGITLTSLLFASIHYQYGPSIVLIHIFILSVGFGLLRKYVNTTAAFLAHAGYNFTLVILSYFLGV